jgi:fluoride ion exporter CrcB/FEX
MMVGSKILLVMLGGSGALSRYAVSLWAAKFLTRFPELHRQPLRCFLIGLALPWQRGFSIMNPQPVFCDGFLGALTTFSSFGLRP